MMRHSLRSKAMISGSFRRSMRTFPPCLWRISMGQSHRRHRSSMRPGDQQRRGLLCHPQTGQVRGAYLPLMLPVPLS